jgi:membrane associated rhomboid family serine protease
VREHQDEDESGVCLPHIQVNELRVNLRTLNMHPPSPQDDPPLESEDSMDNLFLTELSLPWHSFVAPLLLTVGLFAVWLLVPRTEELSWAVSRGAVEQGRSATIVLHMFAHGGLFHLLMNAAALLLIGPRLIARIGAPPIAWFRFAYIFLGSGVAGGAAFLLLNDRPFSSALGASGAIFGLMGALARVHPSTGAAVAILSRRSWLLARMFVRDHLVMFALIAGAILVTGHSAMVAWEAHLGGMLFGLFVAPLFLPACDSARQAG